MARHFPDALTPTASHAPSYYAATCREHVTTTEFAGPARADVCVIGGGYAGLSTALHLARRGVDVVLLEQSLLGWGVSAYLGARLVYDFLSTVHALRRFVRPGEFLERALLLRNRSGRVS